MSEEELMRVRLLAPFPNLEGTEFELTSPETHQYNCFAFAVGETHRWWQPSEEADHFWPAGITRDLTVPSLLAAYGTVGFSSRLLASLPPTLPEGATQVAIYAKDGIATHAARRVEADKWCSKLGPGVDLTHPLEALEGALYGNVVGYAVREPADLE